MKKILLLVAFAAATFSLQAQIPNASFENWNVVGSDTVIDGGWNGTGERIFQSINIQTQQGAVTRTPSQGTYFLGLLNQQNGQQIQLGNQRVAFATTDRPVSFSADVMHFPQAQERFVVVITLKNGNDTVANNVGVFGQAVSNWGALTMNFIYQNNNTPDSCFISFIMAGNQNNQASGNTALFIDNLRFNTFGVSVPEIAKTGNLNNLKVYPNPANTNTKLSFDLNNDSKVSISVFDMAGRQVIAQQNTLGAGKNEVDLDVSALKPGFYTYKVESEGQLVNGKLSIVR